MTIMQICNSQMLPADKLKSSKKIVTYDRTVLCRKQKGGQTDTNVLSSLEAFKTTITNDTTYLLLLLLLLLLIIIIIIPILLLK